MTLEDIRPGSKCRIEGMTAKGALGQRLMDLGFYPGAVIHVIRTAPFIDPVELELDGYYVCIRYSEAQFVEVAK
ncbi:MAG: FeoA family protein [Desulfovibrio sp.]